jgi:hypothetical protein
LTTDKLERRSSWSSLLAATNRLSTRSLQTGQSHGRERCKRLIMNSLEQLTNLELRISICPADSTLTIEVYEMHKVTYRNLRTRVEKSIAAIDTHTVSLKGKLDRTNRIIAKLRCIR